MTFAATRGPEKCSPNSPLKNVVWSPRPSEFQLGTDGRGVHPTLFQQSANPGNSWLSRNPQRKRGRRHGSPSLPLRVAARHRVSCTRRPETIRAKTGEPETKTSDAPQEPRKWNSYFAMASCAAIQCCPTRIRTCLACIGEGRMECVDCMATCPAATRCSRFAVRVPCVSSACCVANSAPTIRRYSETT
jgi:hypothetical protein